MGTDEYPDYDLENKKNLQKLADDAGQDPVDLYIERLVASEGRELWNLWAFGGNLQNPMELHAPAACGADAGRRWRPR